MSYVDMQTYTINNQTLEARLVTFESRLNELFNKVEAKFAEQDTKLAEKVGILTAQGQTLERMNVDMPARFSAAMDGNRKTVAERIGLIEQMIRDNCQALHTTRGEISATQAEVVRVGQAQGSGGSGGGGRNRKLLDPKIVFPLSF